MRLSYCSDFFYRCTVHSNIHTVHSPTDAHLVKLWLKFTLKLDGSYWFRSTTIIRELELSLAKVILILKHWVRLHRNLLFGGKTTCPSMVCVLCAVQSGTKSRSAQHTIHTPYWDMLPYHRIANYDVTLLNVLISIKLYSGSVAGSLMMVVDRNMQEPSNLM